MMSRSEYMRLKISDLPENAVQQYNIESKATKDGYMYLEMKWGCMVSRNQVSSRSNC